jgi:hypothetical protein
MLVVAFGPPARSDLGDRLRRRSLGEMQRERAQYIWACERAAEACGETGDAVRDGGGGEAGAAGLADALTGGHATERFGMRAAERDATRLQAGAGATRAHGAIGRARPRSSGVR